MESLSAPNLCANCGEGEEESGNLKKCSACKMVKYCNRDCQISHRQQHKKECKKRAAEVYDEKLFKEIEREECSICMLTLPIDGSQSTFETCCGKTICNGCVYAMEMSEGKDLCAFCRTPPASSDEDIIKRLKKLMNKSNSESFNRLALAYESGEYGLTLDNQKANELFLKGGELGCAIAHHNLGNSYRLGRGVERDMKKAKYYYELAAMDGNIHARHNLGCSEILAGNYDRAKKHLMIAARAGNKKALKRVKLGYIDGHVSKDEYASTLRAYHERQKEMNSDARDKAAASDMFSY